MNQPNTQLWKRMAALGAAAIVLLLYVLGGGRLSESSQEVARPLATIAAAGGAPVLLGDASDASPDGVDNGGVDNGGVDNGGVDNGSDDGAVVGSDQQRRTPTPGSRPRRTPVATSAPAAAPTQTAAPTHTAAPAQAGPQEIDGLPVIYVDDLPREGRQTLQSIEDGGPFPFDRDGLTFQNREGILPNQPRGYYREYTVITPGEDDRGARRIVAGERGELYYTDDHYDSFARIMER